MNSAALPAAAPKPRWRLRDTVQSARRFAAFTSHALRSVRRRELLAGLAIGTLSAFACVLMSLEVLRMDDYAGVMQQMALMTLAGALIGMLCWVVADRGSDAVLPRGRRIVAAMLATGILSGYALPFVVYRVLDVQSPGERSYRMDGKTRKPPPFWLLQAHEFSQTLLMSGLVFGLIEARRRNRRTADALAHTVHQREQLSRRALEARLTAMQAQVEPHFLFDSLVDIDARYAQDPVAASDLLDRLIAYLRVALPRLRGCGSDAAAEAALVASYLSVVAARHGGLPATRVIVEPQAASARLYPMLLLPLVQCAVRSGRIPESVDLLIRKHADRLHAALRLQAPDLCSRDPEVARLRERLAALYGADADLSCSEPRAGCTELLLNLPYRETQADADRAGS